LAANFGTDETVGKQLLNKGLKENSSKVHIKVLKLNSALQQQERKRKEAVLIKQQNLITHLNA
jgi:hypothetical protein